MGKILKQLYCEHYKRVMCISELKSLSGMIPDNWFMLKRLHSHNKAWNLTVEQQFLKFSKEKKNLEMGSFLQEFGINKKV